MTVSALDVIASLSEPPAVAVATSKWHPDASLLQAWADFLDAHRRRDAVPDDATREDFGLYTRAIEEVEARLRTIPARTPEGLAVKLRWLWFEQKECMPSFNVVIHGAPMPPHLIEDWRDQLFWNLIAEAERMSGIMPAAVASSLPPQPPALAAGTPEPLIELYAKWKRACDEQNPALDRYEEAGHRSFDAENEKDAA